MKREMLIDKKDMPKFLKGKQIPIKPEVYQKVRNECFEKAKPVFEGLAAWRAWSEGQRGSLIR